MSKEIMQKLPSTLADLDMIMVEDHVCGQCVSGECHTKGVAKSTTFLKGTTWYIHIRVNRMACDDPCGTFVYIGDFKTDLVNDSTLNKTDIHFDSELDCVRFLLDNFENILCIN